MTLINDQHMRSLGIPISGGADLVTALSTAGSTKCDTYDVSMRIGPDDQDGFRLPIVEIVGRPFFHGVDGLIGRDILQRMTLFTLIGQESRFILEWPPNESFSSHGVPDRASGNA